ncbi:MAG: deoxyuridine 5'-triphosphate nucleotidohydrolase [Archaeoglobaceae archaeon]|nr:deoxyuridine 5'-triphosphate nucleotidohydrolase [Archaeoglobaceae archaeon]MDW7990265.1 deoxyuridine 5'-triphosphate nucleotidohydrolase [Archaeoglobaceae archaeon]
MCILSSEELRNRIEEGLISGYLNIEVQLQPNGFDCTLRSVKRLNSAGRVDFSNEERVISESEEIEFDEWIYLTPGAYKAILNEIIRLGKDLMAIGRPRSTLLRCGVTVETAVWDAGYEGRSEVLIVVHNPEGVWLKKNARIIQLVFIKLCSVTHGYSGVYKFENISETL